MSESARVPARAWIVTAAGTAVNLCLGILYAWSMWKIALLSKKDHPPGSAMDGLGVTYGLNDNQNPSPEAIPFDIGTGLVMLFSRYIPIVAPTESEKAPKWRLAKTF